MCRRKGTYGKVVFIKQVSTRDPGLVSMKLSGLNTKIYNVLTENSPEAWQWRRVRLPGAINDVLAVSYSCKRSEVHSVGIERRRVGGEAG